MAKGNQTVFFLCCQENLLGLEDIDLSAYRSSRLRQAPQKQHQPNWGYLKMHPFNAHASS